MKAEECVAGSALVECLEGDCYHWRDGRCTWVQAHGKARKQLAELRRRSFSELNKTKDGSAGGEVHKRKRRTA